MTGSVAAKPRLFALWSKHRLGPGAKDEPSSVDKGIAELPALGYQVVSIYPLQIWNKLFGFLRNLFRDRGVMRLTALYLLFTIGPEDIIYTADFGLALLVSQMKRAGFLRNRFIFKWAGMDLDWPAIVADKRRREAREVGKVMIAADACFVVSRHELNWIAATCPEQSRKLCFWPTAIDVDYYRRAQQQAGPAGDYWTATGNDRKRDWDILFKLAERGAPIVLVTEDARVKARFEALGAARPPSLRLEYRVGFQRSAEIMAASQGMIISTTHNHRFSGSTTVGVAAALGKPLLLDEAYDCAAYGLKPGENCEWFVRGDVDGAWEALQRMRTNAAYRAQLAERLAVLAPALDTTAAARVIAAAFDPAWMPNDFVPPRASDESGAPARYPASTLH